MHQLLGEEEKEIGRLYRQLLALFVICWTIYPILFIVGHNGGVLGHSAVLEVITVPLEIVAKGLAGIVVYMHINFLVCCQSQVLTFLCAFHNP